MKLVAMSAVAILCACTNSPPVDNPSSPGSFRPATEEVGEARALEAAEADCVKQGKHAEARRVDGDTVYDCVSR
jgi:hypothetical protein